MLFISWAERWLEIYKKDYVKDNTYWGTYVNPVRCHLIPEFGNRELSEIKPLDVQSYFRKQIDVLSLETQKKIKSALKSIYDTAIENDLCAKNPVTKNIHLSSNILPPQKRAYTEDEYQLVWKYASQHPYGVAIMTLLETGISRSELLGLKWIDFDDSEHPSLWIRRGTVNVKDAETGKWKTASSGLKNQYRNRQIPISNVLANFISRIPREIQISHHNRSIEKVHPQFIFHSPRGLAYSPDNWTKRVYQKFMSDLVLSYPEIPALSVHELRHTRATLWVKNDVDIFTISLMGGWTDLKMLRKRYAHVDVETLRRKVFKEN